MYAIIETGSKQEKVCVGDVVNFELLGPAIKAKANTDIKEVVFDHVLLLQDADRIEIGRPYVNGAKVVAEVLGEIRGPKSISFKSRRRKSSREKKGHRQNYTKVKITEISF